MNDAKEMTDADKCQAEIEATLTKYDCYIEPQVMLSIGAINARVLILKNPPNAPSTEEVASA